MTGQFFYGRQGYNVHLLCDNMESIVVFNKGKVRNSAVNTLIDIMYRAGEHVRVTFSVEHIKGKLNELPDAYNRYKR